MAYYSSRGYLLVGFFQDCGAARQDALTGALIKDLEIISRAGT